MVLDVTMIYKEEVACVQLFFRSRLTRSGPICGGSHFSSLTSHHFIKNVYFPLNVGAGLAWSRKRFSRSSRETPSSFEPGTLTGGQRALQHLVKVL